jgi:hypothetical protein
MDYNPGLVSSLVRDSGDANPTPLDYELKAGTCTGYAFLRTNETFLQANEYYLTLLHTSSSNFRASPRRHVALARISMSCATKQTSAGLYRAVWGGSFYPTVSVVEAPQAIAPSNKSLWKHLESIQLTIPSQLTTTTSHPPRCHTCVVRLGVA